MKASLIGCTVLLLLLVSSHSLENNTASTDERNGREYRVDHNANNLNDTEKRNIEFRPMPSKLPTSTGKASWIPIKLWREERVISSSASRYHVNHVYHVCYIILGLTFLYFNIWKNLKIGEKDSLRIFLMLVHICIVPKVILLIICTNCTELRETQIVEWIDREFVQRYPFNVTPLL